MFKSIYNIAASAMSANRMWINTIASNIANARTTKTEEGGPYQRRDVVFRAVDMTKSENPMIEDKVKGVQVSKIVKDESEPVMVYDPSHPDADPKTGMVAMPNINPVMEMSNLIAASTAYKAAAEVVSTTNELAGAVSKLAQRI